MTESQKYVLSLGPKFCPTPNGVNELQLSEDVIEGNRRLRLKEFFHQDDAPVQKPKHLKFYKKTGWQPPEGRDNALDAYCATLESMTESFTPPDRVKQNLSRSHQQAVRELKNMVAERKIRISSADKGGAVVVQDVQDYEVEALRQLNNKDHYRILTSDPTKSITEQSNSLIGQLGDLEVIDENCTRWGHTDPASVRTQTFYHLPKIHKSKERPPGRPIVSGVSGPTEKISKLIDHFLQPIVKKLPAYLKDTTHFLQTIEDWNKEFGPFPSDTLFVTIDVVGLYTNIPHNEAKDAVKEAMLKNPDIIPDKLTTDLMGEMMHHVLSNNVFTFNDTLYLQTFGTAMGTPMAPTIANLFMGQLEHRLIAASPWNLVTEQWKRFIDDIALLWFQGEDELIKFIEWLNQQHSTIKFTSNYGIGNIPYLDVNVSIQEGKLETTLHVKDTSTNMILPFHSCHPRHCPRSIPFSQCLRLRRICSVDSDFQVHCQNLKENFKKRGYPEQIVENAITKVSQKTREETLRYVNKAVTSERVPYVITHNPRNPPLSHWLRDYLPVLHTSSRLRKAVPNAPIVGERNCPNLKKILMPSQLPSPPVFSESPPAADNGCHTCQKNRCITCHQHLKNTTTFTSTNTKKTFSIRSKTTCTSKNIIYLIECDKCGQQYVGETETPFKKRLYNHRSNINSPQPPTFVSKHFQTNNHSINNMKCTVIEQIPSLRDTEKEREVRKRREKFWRWKLHTNFPDGLNVFD